MLLCQNNTRQRGRIIGSGTTVHPVRVLGWSQVHFRSLDDKTQRNREYIDEDRAVQGEAHGHSAEFAKLGASVWKLLSRMIRRCPHNEHREWYDVLKLLCCKRLGSLHTVRESRLDGDQAPKCAFYTSQAAKNALVARALDITHLHCPNLHKSSKKDIILKIQVLDAFVKKGHNPTPYYANFFYRHSESLLNEFYVCYLEQDEAKAATIALFLLTNTQRNKTIFPLDYVFVHHYFVSFRMHCKG